MSLGALDRDKSGMVEATARRTRGRRRLSLNYVGLRYNFLRWSFTLTVGW